MTDEARYCESCKISLEPRSLKCRYCYAVLEYSSSEKQLRVIGYACYKCGSLNAKNEAFCGTCGAKLSSLCPWCHNTINFGVVVCPVCKRNVMKHKLEEDMKRTIENLQSQIEQARHERELLLRPSAEQIAKENTALSELRRDLGKCRVRFPLIPFLVFLLVYTIIVFVVFEEDKSPLVYILGYGVFAIAALSFLVYQLRLRRRVPPLAHEAEKKQEALNQLILEQQKAEEQSEATRIVRSLERKVEEAKRRLKQDRDRMGW
jgi:hypothetical protein